MAYCKDDPLEMLKAEARSDYDMDIPAVAAAARAMLAALKGSLPILNQLRDAGYSVQIEQADTRAAIAAAEAAGIRTEK